MEKRKESIAPPLGVMPRFIWDEKRLEDLKGAIGRYLAANKPIHIKWVEEYNELVERLGKGAGEHDGPCG